MLGTMLGDICSAESYKSVPALGNVPAASNLTLLLGSHILAYILAGYNQILFIYWALLSCFNPGCQTVPYDQLLNSLAFQMQSKNMSEPNRGVVDREIFKGFLHQKGWCLTANLQDLDASRIVLFEPLATGQLSPLPCENINILAQKVQTPQCW